MKAVAGWNEIGARLRVVNPAMHARLLALAERAVQIEEDPLAVIADDLAAAARVDRDQATAYPPDELADRRGPR